MLLLLRVGLGVVVLYFWSPLLQVAGAGDARITAGKDENCKALHCMARAPAEDVVVDGGDADEPQVSLLQRGAMRIRRGNGSPYAQKLIEMAATEASFNTSVQDSCLPKWPRSWIDQLSAIDKKNHHNFNFVGSIFRSDIVRERRLWVLKFAEERFGTRDFLKVTDVEFKDDYKLIGDFDHTYDEYVSERPNKFSNLVDEDYTPVFDELYWTVMVQSNFTLSPAGDKPDSFRFFEAMLAGSIPIVESPEHTDWGEVCHVSSVIGWKYYLVSDAPDAQYEYRPDWIAENKALAIKYLTYMEGYHAVESA